MKSTPCYSSPQHLPRKHTRSIRTLLHFRNTLLLSPLLALETVAYSSLVGRFPSKSSSMRPFFLSCIGVLALASSTLGQSSSTGTSSTPSSSTSAAATAATASTSLIPTDISQGCADFLTSLDSDQNIQACTAPLLSATKFYTNATESSSKSNKTDSNSSEQALTDSLAKLCDANAGCQPDVIRAQLSKFWTACSAELKEKNEGVLKVYDILYLLNPFHDAVCTKDKDEYCVLNIAQSTVTDEKKTSKRSMFEEDLSLEKRQSASDAASSISSNSTNQTNIAFLFLQPDSDKSTLCSTCSQNVMAAYIQFETSIPYAIGLANSDNLGGQSDLYKAMQKTCGQDFVTGINKQAGTTAFAEVSAALTTLPMQLTLGLGAASLVAWLLA